MEDTATSGNFDSCEAKVNDPDNPESENKTDSLVEGKPVVTNGNTTENSADPEEKSDTSADTDSGGSKEETVEDEESSVEPEAEKEDASDSASANSNDTKADSLELSLKSGLSTRARRKVSSEKVYVENSFSEDESTDDSIISCEDDDDDENETSTSHEGLKRSGDEKDLPQEKRKRGDESKSSESEDDGEINEKSDKEYEHSSKEEPITEILSEKRKRNSVLNVQFSSADEDDELPKRKQRRRNLKTSSDGLTKNGSTPEKIIRRERSIFRPNVSIHELRRTREVFTQYKRCVDFKKGLIKAPRCIECKAQMNGESKVSIEKCRFYGFRKLKVTPKSTISSGFRDPQLDPVDHDVSVWRPAENPVVTPADIEISKFILSHVGDQFCELVEEENKTLSLNEGKLVAWKPVVSRVREMCDVCYTTLFNYQWTCEKCGFVACRDCYSSRFLKKIKPSEFADSNVDEYLWSRCINNRMNSHDLEEMMLSQVIVGDEMNNLHNLFHEVRHEWNLPQTCGCALAQKYPSNTDFEIVPVIQNTMITTISRVPDSDDSSDDEPGDPDLMDLFSAPKENPPVVPVKPPVSVSPMKIENKNLSNSDKRSFVNRPLSLSKTLTETKKLYPTIPHSWLCNGKLLRLLDPVCPDNLKLFQEVWKCGQPVLISKVDTKLNPDLWTPQSFSHDFGRMKGVFVNCMSGRLVQNQYMKVFWDGFEIVPNRLDDEQGNAMLLKLKDWPEKADFKDVLPTRFIDLMKALPLQDYTSREGCYNLTSDLPDRFIKPDLGPKMYVAYGSGLHLDKGTTNLHLDISDAVNVMVYVGEPKDKEENTASHRKAVIDAIKDSDCDSNTIRRVIDGTDIPGALWHIYEARDADKIRNFLNENKILQGIRPNERHDPIHDQSCYLDKKLRKDLMTKYNISGYPIIQCAGDAIFIPAGAPHQVRNLQNCIKVAEDFVSPENVHHCFKLTEEFRRLTEMHSNHEDKLQIKNIAYHSIKDAVSILHHAKRMSSVGYEQPIENDKKEEIETTTTEKEKQEENEVKSTESEIKIESEVDSPASDKKEENGIKTEFNSIESELKIENEMKNEVVNVVVEEGVKKEDENTDFDVAKNVEVKANGSAV